MCKNGYPERGGGERNKKQNITMLTVLHIPSLFTIKNTY